MVVQRLALMAAVSSRTCSFLLHDKDMHAILIDNSKLDERQITTQDKESEMWPAV